MNRKVKIAVLVILSMVTIVACKNDVQPVQTPPTQNDNARLEAKKLRERMNHRIVDTSIPKSIISFKEPSFDFGVIKSGDVMKHRFVFTNTGANALVIFNAQGTCGCTVPSWPSKPVTPGDTGSISIEFNSNNESGLQNKKVRILANTKQAETDISFTANVKK